MADKNLALEDEIIDLTDLIEAGGKSKKIAAYGKAAASAIQDDDGLDDFDEHPAAGKSSAQTNPNELLDMPGMGEIDNLLDSLDVPPQPDEAPKSKPDKSDEDLDSVLDDLLGGTDDGDHQEVKKPEKKAPSFADDLDDLLDEPKPQASKPEPVKSEVDADLDNILASFDEPVPPKPAQPAKQPPKKDIPKKTSVSSPSANVDYDAELDNILLEMDEKPAPQPAAPKQPTGNPVAPAKDNDNFDLPSDLDSLLDEVPAPKPAAQQEVQTMPETKKTVTDFVDSPDYLTPEPVVAAAPAPRSSTPPQYQPDLIAEICRNILTTQSAANQEAFHNFSRLLGGNTARLEDLSKNLTNLNNRLYSCESTLATDKEKIADIEKKIAATSSVGELFREGTELQQGFAGLIASAVGNALEANNAPVAKALQQLGSVQAVQQDLTGRMTNVEQRLNALEPAVNHGVAQEDSETAQLADSMDVSEVQGRLDSLQQLVDEVAGSLDQTKNGLEQLTADIEDLRNSKGGQMDATGLEMLNKAVAEQQALLKSEIEQLSSRLDTTSSGGDQIKALQETVDAATVSIASLQQNLEQIQETTSALNAKVDTLNNDGKEEQLSQLHQNINQMGEQASAAREDLEANQKETKQLAGQIANLSAVSDESGKQLEALRQRLDELNASINDVATQTKDTAEQLAKSVESGGDTQLDALQETVEHLRELTTSLGKSAQVNQNETKEAKARIENLENEKAEAGKNIKALELKLEQLSESLAGQSEGSDHYLEALESVKADADKRMQSLDERITELQSSLTEFMGHEKGSAAQLTGQLAAFDETGINKRMDDLQSQVDKVSGESSRVAGDMQQIKNEIANLNAQLEFVDSGEPEEEKKLDEMQARFDELAATINDGLQLTQNETKQLSGRIDSLSKDGVESGKLLQNLDQQFSELKENIAGQIGQIKEETEKLTQHLEDSSTLKEDVASLRDQLDKITGTINAEIDSANKKVEQNVYEKMAALEKRMDEFVPGFNAHIEKTAAEVVARILHEELRQLMDGN